MKYRKIAIECGKSMFIPFVWATITEIMRNLTGIMTAGILGNFMNAVLYMDWADGRGETGKLIVCLAVIIIVVPGIGLLGDFSMLKHSLKHDRNVFQHFLDRDPSTTVYDEDGELQYELEDAPNDMRIEWVIISSKIVSTVICFGYLLWQVCRLSGWIIIALLLGAGVQIMFPVIVGSRLAQMKREQKVYLGQRKNEEMNVAIAPINIASWRLQTEMVQRIKALYESYMHGKGRQNIRNKVIIEGTQSGIDKSVKIFLFILGGVLVANNLLLPGIFASLLIYLEIVEELLSNVVYVAKEMPSLKMAIRRTADLYGDEENEERDIEASNTSIHLDRVSLSIDGIPVMSQTSGDLVAGKINCIIGNNGVGKTTFLRILSKCMKGYEGRILIGENELRKLSFSKWRNSVSFSEQEPYLFDGSVIENILGCSQYSESDIQILNMWMEKFNIDHLKNKQINNDGGLSGGEKQKVSLIRAIMKRSDYLLLDEPTNHMDIESVKTLIEYLQSREKTAVIVTHDERLIYVADNILKIGECNETKMCTGFKSI